MRGMCKIVCFLTLTGLTLGSIFTLSSMIYDWQSVSPCASEQECQDRYIRNIAHCLSYGSAGTCEDALDPAYIAVGNDRQTRLQKFTDIANIANAEKQKLSPEVLQAKQEKIREALKQRSGISETKVVAAVSLFFTFLILPFICCLVDWFVTRKARKIMLPGEAPSTLITLSLCLFLAGALRGIGIGFISFDFSHFNFATDGLRSGLLLFLTVFAYFLAKATKQEFEKIWNFVCAAKRAKA